MVDFDIFTVQETVLCSLPEGKTNRKNNVEKQCGVVFKCSLF